MEPMSELNGKLSEAEAQQVTGLTLEDFLPYQLTIVSNVVGRGLARLSAARFGLTASEWRVIAVVGRSPGASAQTVCKMTAMDKVRVSRAVSRLLDAGRIHRRTDPQDRRRSKLYLSDDGAAIYDQIVPAARAYEAKLLETFTAEEASTLEQLLGKLRRRTQQLGEGGASHTEQSMLAAKDPSASSA